MLRYSELRHAGVELSKTFKDITQEEQDISGEEEPHANIDQKS
jgi:hypothetical protein